MLLQTNRVNRARNRQRHGVVHKQPFDWNGFWGSVRRVLRYLLMIGVLAVIFVGPYYGWQYLKRSNAFFTIETVSVYGDVDYLSEERVNELVHGAMGQNLIGLDMKAYQDQILAESWIKDVSLNRKWFNELEVYIEEEQPVAVWNTVEMVDRNGETFEPSFMPQKEWAYLTGPSDTAPKVLDVYLKAEAQLAQAGFNLYELILDDTESWTIVLDNNLILIMGSEDFDQRLVRFLKQFPDRGVLDRIQHIDFRYKNGFSVKWKEDSESFLETKRK